jgi:hypothetical protein
MTCSRNGTFIFFPLLFDTLARDLMLACLQPHGAFSPPVASLSIVKVSSVSANVPYDLDRCSIASRTADLIRFVLF